MRRTWAIALVALVCVTGCADVDPSASTGAYDDEADSHAAERAKVVHADAGQPPAETPDSAPAAPDAGTPAVEPAITATAPDANVAPAQAPDAGDPAVLPSMPSAPDAGAPVEKPVPQVITVAAFYDERPIEIVAHNLQQIHQYIDLRVTIHVGAGEPGYDRVEVYDLGNKVALADGIGRIAAWPTWEGDAGGYHLAITFDPSRKTVQTATIHSAEVQVGKWVMAGGFL